MDEKIIDLFDAIRENDVESAKSLIEHDVDVNAQDKNGHTALMRTSLNNQLEIAKLLIENGADVNEKEKHGATALMAASLENSVAVAKLLINSGVDVNVQDKDGHTALIFASRENHIEIVRLLINSGADVNAQDEDGYTAIMSASSENNIEIVKLLIENGVDVNAKTKARATALIAASMNNHIEIVRLLIKNGADVNAKMKKGVNALIFASSKNNTEVAKLLIDSGADVNAKMKNGSTALMASKIEITRLLIKNGADVNVQDEDGYTALMSASSNDNIEIVKLLIENGADVNAKKKNGLTALMYSSAKNFIKITKLLLESGADVNVNMIEDSSTALMSASSENYIEITKLLLESGADVNAKAKDGYTALMGASFNNHIEVAKLLIESGADVNAKKKHGTTALMGASFNNQIEVAKLLIDSGADVNVTYGVPWRVLRNNLSTVLAPIIYYRNKYSVLSKAVKINAMEIVEYLIRNGARIKKSMLEDAIENNNFEMVKLLLSKGLSVTKINFYNVDNNWTIDSEILQFLIGKGLKIDEKLFLELGKNIEIQKILIENTKDKELLAQYGALSKNNPETLRLLKDLNIERGQITFSTRATIFFHNISRKLLRRFTIYLIKSAKNEEVKEKLFENINNGVSLSEIINSFDTETINQYMKKNTIEGKEIQSALRKTRDQEKIDLLMEKIEMKRKYGPELLANALKSFSSDDNLRYTNHPLDDDTLTYDVFKKNLQEGWKKIEADIKGVSPSLHKELSSLLFSEDEAVGGWSSKVIEKDFEDGNLSSDNITGLQKRLKQLIVVKPDDDTKLLKKFTKIRKNNDLQVTIDLKNLKESKIDKFFTDTKRLEKALDTIIKDINEHSEENKEIIVNVEEDDNVIELKIIHINSSSHQTVQKLEDTIKENGGNFRIIYDNLVSVCDWSVDTVCSDGNRYKIDYLYHEIDNSKPHHTKIDNGESKGFTHILRFYV